MLADTNKRLQTIILLSVFIICALSPAVSAQTPSKQIKLYATTSKRVYLPGEDLRLYLNVTNNVNESFLTKEIRVKIIAESWFGITAYEESRSWGRLLRPEAKAWGYTEANLPFYTPIGRYKIVMWMVYGNDSSDPSIVTPQDYETEPAEAEIEVNVGPFFILLIIAVLSVFFYLLLRRIKTQPYRRRPRSLERKPAIDEDEGEYISDRIEKSLILALILSISLTLIWIGNTKQEKEYFSALYIKPGSYSNYVDGDAVSFTYGVECLEKSRTSYELKTYLGNMLVQKKEFELNKEGPYKITQIEEVGSVYIPQNTTFPAKIMLRLNTHDREYETHLWLRGRRGNITYFKTNETSLPSNQTSR